MKVSTTGYKKNSKDKKHKELFIPGDALTMLGVEDYVQATPVYPDGNFGGSVMMKPGVPSYNFPGAMGVIEQKVPLRQNENLLKFAAGGFTGDSYMMMGLTNCPEGKVPDGNGNCVDNLAIPPTSNSSLFEYYQQSLNKYGPEIAAKMISMKRQCHPGDECWKEDVVPLVAQPKSNIDYQQSLRNGRTRPVDADYMILRNDFSLAPNEIPFLNLSPGLRNPGYKTNTPVEETPNLRLRQRKINEEIQNRAASFQNGGRIQKYQEAGAVTNTPRLWDEAMEQLKYLQENPATWQDDPDMQGPGGKLNLCLDCINVDWTNPEHIKDAYRLIEEGYSTGTHYNEEAFHKGLEALGLKPPVYNSKGLPVEDMSVKEIGGPISNFDIYNMPQFMVGGLLHEAQDVGEPKIKKGKTLFGRPYQIVETEAGPTVFGQERPDETTRVKTVYYKNGNVAKQVIKNNEGGGDEVTYHDINGNVTAEKINNGYRTFSNGYFQYGNNTDYENMKRRYDEVENIYSKNKLQELLQRTKLELENMSKKGSQPGDSFNTVWPDWENDRFNYTRTKNPDVKNSNAKFEYGGSLPKAQTLGQFTPSYDYSKSYNENMELNRRAQAMGWNSVKDYEASGWGQRFAGTNLEAPALQNALKNIYAAQHPGPTKFNAELDAENKILDSQEKARRQAEYEWKKNPYNTDPAGLPSVPIFEAALMAPATLTAASGLLGTELLGTGLTLGNIANTGFAAHGAYNFLNPDSDFRQALTEYNKGTGNLTDVAFEGSLNALNFLGAGSLPQDIKAFVNAYKNVATGNSMIPYAWKSPAIGLSQEASADMFNSLINSGKLTPAERRLIIEYQHDSSPFTGRFGPVDAAKRQQLNNIINKYQLEIPENSNVIATRRFNSNKAGQSTLGATEENGSINFGDRPTSFSVGVGRVGYSGAPDRIVIPSRHLSKMKNNVIANEYTPLAEDELQLINKENTRDFARGIGQNIPLSEERELIGTGLNFKQVGKVKNDIGGFDYIVKPLPSSSNTGKFKSEIDWAKWNPDTPKYPELINEYNTIEESTKANGTWMKNPDGSTFKGTPEQFVQQQSSWFKKAFGDSKLVNPDGSPWILEHGSPKKFDVFDESKFQLGDSGYSGSGVYTVPPKGSASSYTTSGAWMHTGDIEPTLYKLYGLGKNPITSEELIKMGTNSPAGKEMDLFNFHRKTAPLNEQLLDYDVAIHNQHRGIERVRNLDDAWEVVFPTNKQLKSAVGNVGFFDMSNPNIYKGLLPPALLLGAGAVAQQKKGGKVTKYNSKSLDDYFTDAWATSRKSS